MLRPSTLAVHQQPRPPSESVIQLSTQVLMDVQRVMSRVRHALVPPIPTIRRMVVKPAVYGMQQETNVSPHVLRGKLQEGVVAVSVL